MKIYCLHCKKETSFTSEKADMKFVAIERLECTECKKSSFRFLDLPNYEPIVLKESD